MHSDVDGATSLRDRRRSEVSARLTQASRRMTAKHGLTGFTVEQVCEEVGVSRRTFFNYFASKEDAIFGLPAHADTTEIDELFLLGGDSASRASATGLSPTLVEDLTALAIARWNHMDLTRENATEMFEALRREPRLLQRLLDISRSQELADIALVERREHLASGDPRASTLVQVMGAVLRSAAQDVLTQATPDTFPDTLAARLATTRALFS